MTYFFNSVTRACRVETHLDTLKFWKILEASIERSLDAARKSAYAT